MYPRLSLVLYAPSPAIAQSLVDLLSDERYRLQQVETTKEFREYIQKNTEDIDCLIVFYDSTLLPCFNQLYEQGTLLPVIIIDSPSTYPSETSNPREGATHLYHNSEIEITRQEIDHIALTIERAISQFLHLAPSCPLTPQLSSSDQPNQGEDPQSFLLMQQRRLAEKLKERLGYLGVYYKRNPKNFWRNLAPDDKKELKNQLLLDYREIVLNYFVQDSPLNQLIDQFVNRAFFADVSASQILEIHMGLMDEFAQQLKLEGRSEEILLDYRLTLIDILAHLGEMYRRSIPREDIPLDLLYQID